MVLATQNYMPEYAATYFGIRINNSLKKCYRLLNHAYRISTISSELSPNAHRLSMLINVMITPNDCSDWHTQVLLFRHSPVNRNLQSRQNKLPQSITHHFRERRIKRKVKRTQSAIGMPCRHCPFCFGLPRSCGRKKLADQLKIPRPLPRGRYP